MTKEFQYFPENEKCRNSFYVKGDLQKIKPSGQFFTTNTLEPVVLNIQGSASSKHYQSLQYSYPISNKDPTQYHPPSNCFDKCNCKYSLVELIREK